MYTGCARLANRRSQRRQAGGGIHPGMNTTPSSRATIRLGVVALMLGALAGLWELLALQAPGTLLYIGMLSGPIGALRELALLLGLLLIAAGLLLPWASQGREPGVLVGLLYLGTALGLSAQVYGAAHGMNGVQLGDLRPDALPLFIAKQGGLLLFAVAMLELGRRVLVKPAPDPDGPRSAMGGQGHALGASRARIAGHRAAARQLDPGDRGN